MGHVGALFCTSHESISVQGYIVQPMSDPSKIGTSANKEVGLGLVKCADSLVMQNIYPLFWTSSVLCL